jgi:hypothetical protein
MFTIYIDEKPKTIVQFSKSFACDDEESTKYKNEITSIDQQDIMRTDRYVGYFYKGKPEYFYGIPKEEVMMTRFDYRCLHLI